MKHLVLFAIVTSVVMGAAGVVYMIHSIRRKEDRRKHVALTTAFFFGCLVAGLLAAYLAKKTGKRGGGYSAAGVREEIRMDPSVMIAASAGAGSTMA